MPDSTQPPTDPIPMDVNPDLVSGDTQDVKLDSLRNDAGEIWPFRFLTKSINIK
jgi:hypothetical protein